MPGRTAAAVRSSASRTIFPMARSFSNSSCERMDIEVGCHDNKRGARPWLRVGPWRSFSEKKVHKAFGAAAQIFFRLSHVVPVSSNRHAEDIDQTCSRWDAMGDALRSCKHARGVTTGPGARPDR